ncbi:hypothetical protein F4808DRAFT_68274 [Astrocystis sublimbata]|nr:hypothetical protein F4808DRAFT_68274 [Astrocystis sublimbata]
MLPVLFQQQSKPRQMSAVCYDVCNNANIEAQRVGKSPSLCATKSVFISFYSDCLACLQENPSPDTSESVDEQFRDFNDYCQSVGVDVPEAITTTLVVTIDHRTVTVPLTTVLGVGTYVSNSTTLSSTAATPFQNSTTTATGGTSFSSTLTSPTALPTDTSESNQGSRSLSQARIAAAAVGSVAGAILLIILPALLYHRRRQRQQQRHREQDTFEKAQLHSDCIPRQELDGTQVGELEAPVAELEGTKQLAELPDATGKHPGNASNS